MQKWLHRRSLVAPNQWQSLVARIFQAKKKKKKKAAFTFTRYVHAEVDAVDRVHIDGAWRHEHGRVPRGAFTPCRVRRLVLPAEVGFSLHDSPPQLGAICAPASQHLHTQRFDSIINYYLFVCLFSLIKALILKCASLLCPASLWPGWCTAA